MKSALTNNTIKSYFNELTCKICNLDIKNLFRRNWVNTMAIHLNKSHNLRPFGSCLECYLVFKSSTTSDRHYNSANECINILNLKHQQKLVIDNKTTNRIKRKLGINKNLKECIGSCSICYLSYYHNNTIKNHSKNKTTKTCNSFPNLI